MDKRAERALWTAWEYIKLIGVLAFAMAAGAATYHQYLVQRHMLAILAQIRIERVAGQIQLPEAQLPEMMELIQEETPDDLAAEAEMDELELLAVCVEAEAGNQGLEGKRLVADVILNRVDDPDFPDTITGVISQPYVPCVALGKAGEFAEKYLRRGMKIAVEGRIQTGSYTNRDGQKVYTVEVMVEKHEFADGKRNDDGSRQEEYAAPDADGFMNIPEGMDEDIPFA